MATGTPTVPSTVTSFYIVYATSSLTDAVGSSTTGVTGALATESPGAAGRGYEMGNEQVLGKVVMGMVVGMGVLVGGWI